MTRTFDNILGFDIRRVLFLLMFFLIFISASYCRAEKLPVYRDGSNVIRGNLPSAWATMTEEDLGALAGMPEQLDSPNMNFLSGYRYASPEKTSAMLFVFYVNSSERVSWEERQKMFNWFKKNRGLMSGLLPENIQEYTLEDIEYLQNKDTLVFESKVKVDGMDLRGVNGIVFLRQGYLNIFGYVAGGSLQQLNDCYSFIKTLEVSPSLQYSKKQASFLDDYQWLQGHWQQILGGAVFVLVYGVIFLHRDKNRLAV